VRKVEGGSVAKIILDIPEELIFELRSRAEERSKSYSDSVVVREMRA
jgi:hypothetical protein